MGAVYPKVLSAEEAVERLNARFGTYFADNQVHVKLDDGILSDAAAGADYVKIKRGAMFSEREVDLLEVHEGWVHMGTSLNGARQHVATWLAKGPPCTLAIQEGFAALVEVITFNATPRRTKTLVNRILACDKAEDGANFLEICEFYRTEGFSEKECYQYAQRVFRGGVVSGGAPFTKDICYCKGFVMTYNFLRTAIRFGRPELIPLLFFGKLTLDDVPVLCRKVREGVVDPPRYLPPQFSRSQRLAMWMAYSNFFNRVNLSSIQDHYRSQMALRRLTGNGVCVRPSSSSPFFVLTSFLQFRSFPWLSTRRHQSRPPPDCRRRLRLPLPRVDHADRDRRHPGVLQARILAADRQLQGARRRAMPCCCSTTTQRRRGVVAASAGNHALGLAYHGSLLEIGVTVVMPKFAPLIKIDHLPPAGWPT